jgi:hypothetical protein
MSEPGPISTTPALRCWISGIGLLAPGLPGWAASQPVLSGAAPWEDRPVALPPPAMLPPTERRRTSTVVRLALAAAAEAAAASALPPAVLDTVFASSNGDGAVVAAILEALADPQGSVSPTQFHNSVHNAAAGYWGIGAGSQRPSVSLGCHDDTLPLGLLQAAAGVATRRRPILFCAYDAPLPAPLSAARATGAVFAMALVLLPAPDSTALASLDLRFGAPLPPGAPEPGPAIDNPIARGLPLLRALARRRAASTAFALADGGSLLAELAPC